MNLANNLTVFRILLVPIFAGSLFYYSPERGLLYGIGLGIFLLACLTDAVDGYVARKMGQKTILGSYIDPIADKLLLLTGFLSLSFMGHLPPSMKIPAWVTISVVARDILIFIGSVMIFVIQGSLKAEPNFVGKITTVFQMSTLWVALIAAPKFLQNAFFVSTVILTVISGILYIRMGGRLLQTPS